jgi:hypothetical protein
MSVKAMPRRSSLYTTECPDGKQATLISVSDGIDIIAYKRARKNQ